MELRQRKRISNLQKFNSGVGSSTQTLQGTVNGMQAYKTQITSLPTQSETKSMKLPSSSASKAGAKGGGGAGIGSIASMGAQDLTYTLNTLTNPVQDSDLIAGAGTSTGSINGVNFQQQNYVDGGQLMKENKAEGISNTISMTGHGVTAGATIGGPIGAAIGGVLGLGLGLFNAGARRKALRKAIWNANQLTEKRNIFNRSGAYTESLQNQYYQDYGDTRNQILNANRGKD